MKGHFPASAKIEAPHSPAGLAGRGMRSLLRFNHPVVALRYLDYNPFATLSAGRIPSEERTKHVILHRLSHYTHDDFKEVYEDRFGFLKTDEPDS